MDVWTTGSGQVWALCSSGNVHVLNPAFAPADTAGANSTSQPVPAPPSTAAAAASPPIMSPPPLRASPASDLARPEAEIPTLSPEDGADNADNADNAGEPIVDDSTDRDVGVEPDDAAFEPECETPTAAHADDASDSTSVAMLTHAPSVPPEQVYECWENQRLSGERWTSQLLPTDRFAWSDSSGQREMRQEMVHLPSTRWVWRTNWTVQIDASTDKDGWQYAADFRRSFHPTYRSGNVVRRRRWFRQCELNAAPQRWLTLETLVPQHGAVKSVCASDAAAWVVTDQWKVFFRHGLGGDGSSGDLVDSSSGSPAVTPGVEVSGPGGDGDGCGCGSIDGSRWEEVSTPQVSINWVGHGQIVMVPAGDVLLLALDGCLYLRRGQTPANPLGSKWVHIAHSCGIKRVAATDETLWIIDTEDCIYLRESYRSSSRSAARRKWVRIEHPPGAHSTLRSLAVSADPPVLWCIDKHGSIYARDRLAAATPAGTSWSL